LILWVTDGDLWPSCHRQQAIVLKNFCFEKITIRNIVILGRWIEARLMRQDGGRDRPCEAQRSNRRRTDSRGNGIVLVAGATSVIGPETGSGLKRAPMPGGLAIRVHYASLGPQARTANPLKRLSRRQKRTFRAGRAISRQFLPTRSAATNGVPTC
jgi:hypothetical protein